MLDRKAMPILSVLILVMLVSDIWLITHDARRSMALFIPPVTMMIVPGVFVLKERRARWLLRMFLQPGRNGAAFS